MTSEKLVRHTVPRLNWAGRALLRGGGGGAGLVAQEYGVEGSSEQDSAQSLEMRQGKVAAHYEEAQLLQFSLSGARTFFKDG